MSNCEFCGEEGAVRRLRWRLRDGLTRSFVVFSCKTCNEQAAPKRRLRKPCLTSSRFARWWEEQMGEGL